MSTIYGVNAQTYHRLPPEDQASIRNSFQARQEQDAPARPAPAAEPLPAPTVDGATTPREAVAALHDLPPPDTGDLAPLPPDLRSALAQERAEVYNATRASAAQAALDRFAPTREDFSSLPGRTGDMEYADARSAWSQDPYAQELQRIVDEANASPGEIPAYLTAADATADTQQFTPDQVRDALSLLGVDLPADGSPEQLDAGRQILATVPDDLLGTLVNPGSQVSFTGGGGVGTPNLAGPNVQYNVDVEGRVELSDVQTGVDFEQTQQFEMSVQVQGGAAFDVSRTLPQKLYKWADRLGKLPDEVRDLANSSPLLKQVAKGLPVTGSYTEFQGERLSYEATVTPQQGAQLAEGDASGMPNPLAPLEMPEGTSVLMRGQSLEGSSFEANWKALTIGGTHTELSGLGFGVTRGEGSIVEVYSGPVETVENSAFLGLGRQGALAIGISSDLSMETREMQIARIDLSTEEGQAAYQAFVSTGQVPDWAPPGVQQSGTTEVFSHEYARSIGLQVGGLEIGGSSDANGNITRTTWADGTTEYSNTYTSAGGVTTDVRYALDASGKPDYAGATWTVVRADLDPALANYLESAYDPSRANAFPDQPQHAQMVLSTDQLMDLRDRAREYVLQNQGQGKLDNLDSGAETPWWSSQEEALAIAQTPEEVFAVLGNDMHGGAVIESLLAMSHDGGPLPGEFRMIDAG
ncbi:hypothetical protein LDO32_05220 [Luteimonas sp. Y-2-2-4F]|nr:hypothetical protein [Luteimonas sp. Y-2-2-4F]MCD9031131.1 hypothetical protein [Luteimonas sp. Y-2-2-4F]